MYPMLYVSRLSATPTRSLIRHAIFSQIGPPELIDYSLQIGRYSSAKSTVETKK